MLEYIPRIAKRATTYSELIRARHLLETASQNSELRRVYEGFYRQLPLSLATNPISAFPRLFVRQSPYRHQTQRPSNFYLPHLEASPWWPNDTTSNILVENLGIIQKEYDALRAKSKNHPQAYLVDKGNWLTFDLFRNGKIEQNCRLCPRTTDIIESLPLCDKVTRFVYFSVMLPGTKIKPHCGPVNTRIRYHLTLSFDEQAWMRVGAEKRSWKPGECLVFDDSFEHEVQHNGHAPRAVLLVDCWHPALSALERKWLEKLYAELSVTGQ
jgi:hypothetical protein